MSINRGRRVLAKHALISVSLGSLPPAGFSQSCQPHPKHQNKTGLSQHMISSNTASAYRHMANIVLSVTILFTIFLPQQWGKKCHVWVCVGWGRDTIAVAYVVRDMVCYKQYDCHNNVCIYSRINCLLIKQCCLHTVVVMSSLVLARALQHVREVSYYWKEVHGDWLYIVFSL